MFLNSLPEVRCIPFDACKAKLLVKIFILADYRQKQGKPVWVDCITRQGINA